MNNEFEALTSEDLGAASSDTSVAGRFHALWQHRWFRLLCGFLGWTVISLANIAQLYLEYHAKMPNMTWRELWPGEFSFWYGWLLLAPAVFWISRRHRFDRRFWKRSLVTHLIAAEAILFLHLLLRLLLARVLYGFAGQPVPTEFSILFTSFSSFFSGINYTTRLFVYGALVLVEHVTFYYRRFQQEELQRSQLQSQLAQAQLRALKMQLQPHFLFNTLNSISALLHRDVEKADTMITRLGDFLRMTLEHGGEQLMPLRKELEFAECYLAIEKTRFEDRLSVDVSVAPEARDVLVPSLILQPILENAVRHGIASADRPGRIEIRGACDARRLDLEVRDNGPGLGSRSAMETATKGGGVGFANTRARLMQLYGEEYRLDLITNDSGGLTVKLQLPRRQEPFSQGGTHA